MIIINMVLHFHFYLFLNSSIKLSDDFKRELNNEKLLYDPEPKFNFNFLYLCIGFTVPFGPFHLSKTRHYGSRFF
jgi:hypothetical protein